MNTVNRTLRLADFGLVEMKGWPGKLIRLGQGLNGDGWSTYEHAFGYVGNGKIIEAEVGGARLADLSEYSGLKIRWSSGLFDLTDDQRDDIVANLMGFQGVGYSAADYFCLACHRFHIPAPGLENYIKTSGHMICSQLIDRAYNLAGVHLFTDERWDGDVTPGDLNQLLDWRERLALAA